MISEIQLENFKAFGSCQKVNIKPITLIYGANSAGKSSILQSLLLLKQTFEESSDPKTPLLYKGSLTDQQNFSRCVNGRDVKKNIILGIEFGNELDYFEQERTDDDPVNIICKSFGHERHKYEFKYIYGNSKTILNEITYSINNAILCSLNLVESVGVFRRHSETIEEHYTQSNIDYDILYSNKLSNLDIYNIDTAAINEELMLIVYKAISDIFCEFKEEKRIYYQKIFDYNTFKSELIDYLGLTAIFVRNGLPECYATNAEFSGPKCLIQLNDKELDSFYIEPTYKTASDGSFISSINRSRTLGDIEHMYEYIVQTLTTVASPNIIKSLNKISYIGPLRKKPERFTDIVKDAYSSVGIDGEYTSSIIYDNPKLVKDINSALSDLKVNYKIKIHKITGDDQIALGDIHSLQIIENDTNTPLTLCDVGFGISQILPILVQSLMPGASTVLIEQPEIHLHPKMQSELGDFFISSAKSKQKQFIIETHSEHLLLRIMRRIRETTTGKLADQSLALTPEDVSVLYVESVDGESIVREMPLNEYGELVVPWPGGFFEEGLREVF